MKPYSIFIDYRRYGNLGNKLPLTHSVAHARWTVLYAGADTQGRELVRVSTRYPTRGTCSVYS